MHRIPKILHQTHKTGELPVSCQGYVERLKRLHPGWAYHFYDDEACGRLITNEMPTLLPLYRQPDLLPVQRADIFRLVVVYLRGGFYLDIDMDMHRALDDLLDFGAVFAIELLLTEERCRELHHDDAVRIGNYAFGAEPGHPFLKHLIHALVLGAHAFAPPETEHELLEQTGPGFVTTQYHRYMRSNPDGDIHLLGLAQRLCGVCRGQCCQFGEYASHKHMGSWRWES